MGSAFSRALRLAPANSRGFVFYNPGSGFWPEAFLITITLIL